MQELKIGTERITVDSSFALELQIALSELHGRKCKAIGKCGDMEIADQIAAELASITRIHKALSDISGQG